MKPGKRYCSLSDATQISRMGVKGYELLSSDFRYSYFQIKRKDRNLFQSPADPSETKTAPRFELGESASSWNALITECCSEKWTDAFGL
jgi:hypothetical protein